ncbi:hypothetical protein DFJ73DRAFT_815164 [Zopfochytrium polystomum]|nr:hypothetical protein DFJ73DRAFT_815164 [Zopfochytrium polystomum]
MASGLALGMGLRGGSVDGTGLRGRSWWWACLWTWCLGPVIAAGSVFSSIVRLGSSECRDRDGNKCLIARSAPLPLHGQLLPLALLTPAADVVGQRVAVARFN